MKKLNNQGFGAIEVVLVLAVVGLLGFVGYRAYTVYTASEDNDGQLSGKVEKKEEAEKDPEEKDDQTANWELYSSQNNQYEVAMPDGWELTSLKGSDDIIAWDAKDIKYQAGKRGKVTVIDGGRDGNSTAFYLIYNYKKNEGSFKSPDLKQEKVYTTKNNIKVKKSSRVQTIDPSTTAMAMGIPKDTKQYTYDLTFNDRNLHIVHDVLKGEKDQSALIETMINTLVFK